VTEVLKLVLEILVYGVAGGIGAALAIRFVPR
jgi:hypothetical protein